MSAPLAYFITWSCYGLRLHGDERGTVDEAHNARGTAFLAPNPARLAYEHRLLKHPPLVLADQMRTVVEAAVRDHAGHRGWRLLIINVRTTHVHVVVQGAVVRPESVMGQFKAWSTRRLREAGLLAAERDAWAFHGSTRWINTAESLAAAIRYVRDQ